MELSKLLQELSAARTEQKSFTYSVFKRFVVPPSIGAYDLSKEKHSIALQGSRGCGKTTYIRYFSHWTQFDKSRDYVEAEDLESIVLYWKPDTLFYRSMSKGWLPEEISNNFFLTISGLELFSELLSAIDNIGFHWPDVIVELDGSTDFWEAMYVITGRQKCNIPDILQWIKVELYKARTAIKKGNVSALPEIEPSSMFELLLPIIQRSCTRIKGLRFSVFIDEFENLDEKQQKIINGYRKSSNATLTWNVAYKRFATITQATDGDESLKHFDDYREMFMEEVYGAKRPPSSTTPGVFESTPESKLFTSEIFLLSLLSDQVWTSIEHLNIEVLGSQEKIDLRNSDLYKADIIKVMERIFPTVNAPQLAKCAMNKPSIKRVVKAALQEVEGISEKQVDEFMANNPSAALVSRCISKQKTFKTEQLLAFINKEEPGYSSYVERTNTFKIAALLSLNTQSYFNIPIYSGFERFIMMSQNNIRYFTELCYHSLHQLDGNLKVDSIENFQPVTPDQMHQGAIEASGSLVEHVINFEPLGQSLARMVQRLGALFREYQRQTVISEPEKVSFIIKGDFGDLAEDLRKLINSAKCWRVLLEGDLTRDKKSSAVSSAGHLYRLNPIYSPCFDISYKSGRTVELSEESFRLICMGSNEEYHCWLKSIFAKKDDSKHPQKNLFE